jgi:gliding motility-associated-like protein
MKKQVPFFILLCLICFVGKADHITGGEMYYTYSPSSFQGSYIYNFTLKLYMRCNSGRSFNNPTIISIFDKVSGSRVMDLDVPLNKMETISLTTPDPCISNPPTVCYEIGYYYFTVTLPGLPDGYIVAGQVNYRVGGIANLSPGYSQVGATYTAIIPGTTQNLAANNSARFIGSDLVIVCANNRFSYSFAAEDADNDELRYSFCDAYRSSNGPSGGGGGFGNTGNNASPPLSPPYQPVPYGGGFDGWQPLGKDVSIDPNTGLITGIAPSPGIYVITVCVEEIRAGKVIAVQRKDLQISITSCNITAAILQPEYMLCRDTKTLTVANLSLSSLINDYDWKFTNASGDVVFNTKQPIASHSFADTGTYNIKLVINPGQRCTDSTTSIVRVYPGFYPDFDFKGICVAKPTVFTDKSTTVYGTVNSWNWNFGESNATTEIQNPNHTYEAASTKTVSLISTNTKGCRDTILKPIEIVLNPPLLLAFKDTLICPPDQLQLRALGTGVYTWSPNQEITTTNTGFPIVSPIVTTTYYADLNDNGCLNRDSVLVRVTNKVDIKAMPDTTICQGDEIQLWVTSNANLYTWTPANQLNNAFSKTPQAITQSNTVYTVRGTISNCVATDDVLVKTVPYPISNAGPDTLICFGTTAFLHATTNGSSYKWETNATLSNTTQLNTLATPKLLNNPYVFYAYDNLGCPKPGIDTVVVIMFPKVEAYAGRDTALVIGESLPLNARGGTRYEWFPPTGLSATNIANPIALFSEPTNLQRYMVTVFNEAGCRDSAFLTLKVYSTLPTVFVPTAFTPNGDGKNDLLRPIAVGISKIERFSIYNRYGQTIFTTTTNGHGWDGRINGQLQQTGSYVWMVKAIDFLGKPILQQGTSVLIR